MSRRSRIRRAWLALVPAALLVGVFATPAFATQTSRPAVSTAATEPFGPPISGLLTFPGEDIASCCFRPPDTHGAVGLTQFVEVTNGEGVTVFAKSNGAKQKQT